MQTALTVINSMTKPFVQAHVIAVRLPVRKPVLMRYNEQGTKEVAPQNEAQHYE